MKAEDLKVRFVKDLKVHANAVCVFWLDEIHVDETLKESSALPDILAHEQKHYRKIQRIIKTKSAWLRGFLWLCNDLWCGFDTFKIDAKHFRGNLVRSFAFSIVILTFLVIYLLALTFGGF